jgi:hypothetical protein
MTSCTCIHTYSTLSYTHIFPYIDINLKKAGVVDRCTVYPGTYIYTYVCIFRYVYIRIYRYMYAYLDIYIDMYIHIYTYIDTYIYTSYS